LPNHGEAISQLQRPLQKIRNVSELTFLTLRSVTLKKPSLPVVTNYWRGAAIGLSCSSKIGTP
jgi:hypothetical protein